MDLSRWLKDNIVPSETGKLYLSDIEKRLKWKFSNQDIGREMRRSFHVSTKTVRNKDFWEKLTKEYTGVEWRSKTLIQPCVSIQQQSDGILTVNSKHDKPPQLPEISLQQHIKLNHSDHDDIKNILKYVTQEESKNEETLAINEKILVMLKSQLQNLDRNPKSRRRHPQIIRLCLSLYCRSPKNYEFLSKGGYLILPSSKQLRRYKNRVDQKAGFNKDVLEWMKTEAALQNIPMEGYEGGLLIDEMTIQDDLQLKRVGEEFELIGFVECCPESEYMNTLMGKHEVQLATHVLQMLFLSHTGFRFPVAHFPNVQTSASELYLLFWNMVKILGLYGFQVTYVSLDGAQTNRSFMKMLLPEEQKTSDTMGTMMFSNIFDPSLPKISFIMDYSHVMKKIRNNVSKSGLSPNHKKLLLLKGRYIIWDHWLKAYQWDVTNNTFKVYPRLTQDHFFLNSQLKMRNKLAEDVLNKEMLHLMVLYQKSLDNEAELKSTIELLQHTSVLVSVFRDMRPVSEHTDSRIDDLRKVLKWFQEWEREMKESSSSTDKSLLSFQTREDVVSLTLRFDSMCLEKFKRSKGSIVPGRVNSDAIENIFSQQRGMHNGSNSNPDYLTYSRTMNAIILGEKSVSRKSNTGGVKECGMYQKLFCTEQKTAEDLPTENEIRYENLTPEP